MFYCTQPVLQVSDTIAKKCAPLQRSAIIIDNQPKSCKECELMTIPNYKRCNVAIRLLESVQETAIPHFTSHIDKKVHEYNTRGNLSTLRLPKVITEAAKIHLRAKALLVTKKL